MINLIQLALGAPQILLLLITFPLNLLVYGLANRNIASNSNRDTKMAFWLGILGLLGMVICLFLSVKPTWKKVFFGLGRFFIWAIGIQILGELGLVTEGLKEILHYVIGFPFILRGKNVFNYSTIKKTTSIKKE